MSPASYTSPLNGRRLPDRQPISDPAIGDRLDAGEIEGTARALLEHLDR